MSLSFPPLDDGDALLDLQTSVTALETYLSDIPSQGIRRWTFNGDHARSAISDKTPATHQVSSTLTDPNYDAGDYVFNVLGWSSLWFSTYTTDGGSDTDANKGTGRWSILGHPTASPDTAVTAQIAIQTDLGMSNSDPGEGCSSILIQGNAELRLIDYTTLDNLTVHACVQFQSGGDDEWFTIHSSNRIWNLATLQGLAQPKTVNIDINIVELLTLALVQDAVDSTAVKAVRMMLAISKGGATLAAPTGLQFTIGNWNFSAVGLYSKDVA